MTRFCLALALLIAAGCDTTEPPVEPPADRLLYVGNQGNFSDNNGSVTRYDIGTETVTADAVPDLGGLVQNLLVAVEKGQKLFGDGLEFGADVAGKVGDSLDF